MAPHAHHRTPRRWQLSSRLGRVHRAGRHEGTLRRRVRGPLAAGGSGVPGVGCCHHRLVSLVRLH